MMGTAYQRKISEEEAREGYVFVLKDSLGFFPALGREFEVQVGGGVRKSMLEARACQCRGPEKPHDHFFFRWEALHRGDVVVVQQDSKKANGYHLQIRSKQAQREFCG